MEETFLIAGEFFLALKVFSSKYPDLDRDRQTFTNTHHICTKKCKCSILRMPDGFYKGCQSKSVVAGPTITQT